MYSTFCNIINITINNNHARTSKTIVPICCYYADCYLSISQSSYWKRRRPMHQVITYTNSAPVFVYVCMWVLPLTCAKLMITFFICIVQPSTSIGVEPATSQRSAVRLTDTGPKTDWLLLFQSRKFICTTTCNTQQILIATTNRYRQQYGSTAVWIDENLIFPDKKARTLEEQEAQIIFLRLYSIKCWQFAWREAKQSCINNQYLAKRMDIVW